MPAPILDATDLIQQAGNCIDNAQAVKSSPLYAYCQTNGNWFITNYDSTSESNGCLCKPGYYYSQFSTQCLGIKFNYILIIENNRVLNIDKEFN